MVKRKYSLEVCRECRMQPVSSFRGDQRITGDDG